MSPQPPRINCTQPKSDGAASGTTVPPRTCDCSSENVGNPPARFHWLHNGTRQTELLIMDQTGGRQEDLTALCVMEWTDRTLNHSQLFHAGEFTLYVDSVCVENVGLGHSSREHNNPRERTKLEWIIMLSRNSVCVENMGFGHSSRESIIIHESESRVDYHALEE